MCKTNNIQKVFWTQRIRSAQITSDQLRSIQISSDQLISDQLRSVQISSAQLNSDQLSCAQISSAQISSDQLRSNQISSDQLRSAQLRWVQISSDQLSSDQLRPTQKLRSAQLRSAIFKDIRIFNISAYLCIHGHSDIHKYLHPFQRFKYMHISLTVCILIRSRVYSSHPQPFT